MTIIRRFVGDLQTLGEREFKGVAATSDLQPDGWALDMAGVNLQRFASGKGPLLDEHDPAEILGVVTSISSQKTTLPFTARFSSPGVSDLADQRCRQLKDGVANTFSIAFAIEESQPIHGAPTGSRRATKWTLLEVSLASVPVDPKAIVTARARRNMDAITKAQAAATVAQDEHKAGSRHHTAMADTLERLDEHRRQVGTHLRAMQRALEAGNHEEARQAHERCSRCMKGVERELRSIGDRHGDAQDSHSALARAMRDAWSALGADSGPVTGKGGLKDTEPDLDDAGKRSRKLDRLELSMEADTPGITALNTRICDPNTSDKVRSRLKELRNLMIEGNSY